MIQSVSFPRTFKKLDIIKFLYKNKLIPIKDTDFSQINYYRFRIKDPKQFDSYYSKKLKNGVILTIGIKKNI